MVMSSVREYYPLIQAAIDIDAADKLITLFTKTDVWVTLVVEIIQNIRERKIVLRGDYKRRLQKHGNFARGLLIRKGGFKRRASSLRQKPGPALIHLLFEALVDWARHADGDDSDN